MHDADCFMLQMNAVIDERNEFMVKKLREIEGTVVGVVGALHIPGMQKIWQEALKVSCIWIA